MSTHFEKETLKKLVESKGPYRLRVVSDSMLPLIQVNEEITLLPIKSFKQLKKFSLIVFEVDNTLWCHFIWSINHSREAFSTRSLKNPYENDPEAKFHNAVGEVSSHKLSSFVKMKLLLTNYLLGSS